MDTRYAQVLFIILLALAVYTLFFSGKPPEGPSPEECSEGQTEDCAIGPCNGTRTCANSSWSGCEWQIVCKPGSIAPCEGSVCAGTHRVCNVCGSGYGPCVQSDKVG